MERDVKLPDGTEIKINSNGHLESITPSKKGYQILAPNISFGDYTFDVNKLGELLDTLMKENENKKCIHELSERLGAKLKEGVPIDEAYNEVYGFDLIKK